MGSLSFPYKCAHADRTCILRTVHVWMLQVAEALRRGILTLYDRHLAADGKSVDYKGLRADPDFQLFVDASAELQKLDVSGFSRQERMAFWINMYNVLVVRLICTALLRVILSFCSLQHACASALSRPELSVSLAPVRIIWHG